jgi:hypothetical protein
MLWLSRRPEWQRSREFETTTNSSLPGYYGYRESDNAFIDEDRGGDEEVSGKTRMRVVFQPTTETTHTIFYRGHWLRVKRGRKSNGYEMLSIRYAVPEHVAVAVQWSDLLKTPWYCRTGFVVSSRAATRFSNSSSCKRKRSTRRKPSTGSKYILPTRMARGVTPTPAISARCLLLY